MPIAPTVDAILWDMDGTLIDSTAAVPAAFVATVEELGGPPVTESAIVTAYPMGAPEVILAHFVGRGLRDGESERYYRRLRAAVVHPYPGVYDAVVRINRGWPVGVCTGASHLAARILLGQAGLVHLFGVLVGSDEVANPKPAPDSILEGCRRLGHPPGAVAYVGDAPTDLLAARHAGALAVAAGWGHLYSPDAPADVTLTAPHQALDLLRRPS